jgi:hypothetical protein
MFDKDKTASKRPTEELKMIQQLNARLKETEQSLQQLQIDRNKLIQDKLRSDDQLQRRQDEVEQLKATMEKIIEDNYREGEQMTQEIEYWRQQALTAKRQNASLADRRNSNPNPPPARLQLVPAAPSNPAAAPRQPLPLQLQMPQQPQQPQQPQPPPQPPPQAQTIPQAAPPNDFTTTCYDPDRGYFPCTVRQ